MAGPAVHVGDHDRKWPAPAGVAGGARVAWRASEELLLGQEAEQDFVELGAVRPEHAVRCVFDLHVLGGRKALGEFTACRVDRQDAVFRSVDDQGRDTRLASDTGESRSAGLVVIGRLRHGPPCRQLGLDSADLRFDGADRVGAQL